MSELAVPGSPRGSTRVAAVIGDPVTHSLSPVLHNAGFRAAGLDWVYVAFPVAAGSAPAALDAMRTFGLGGLSVTMPHKEAVAVALAGRLSGAAQRLGAVNCVRRDDAGLFGENTDGRGFVDSLRHEAGVDPSGACVAVVGAGGAGRAVTEALAEAGAARILVVNRNRARAEQAVALAGPVGELAEESAIAAADIVVNATSLGMGVRPPTEAVLPFDVALLRAGQVVADLVYQPIRTGLLEAAAARGATTVNGVGMLLHQAAYAFELWTGVAAPVGAMRDAVLGHLQQ